MFKHFKKNDLFDFYAERRPVFKNPESSSADHLVRSAERLLRELRGEVGEPKAKKTPKKSTKLPTVPSSRPRTFHTGRADTRELVEPPASHPGAVDQVAEAIVLERFMSKEEAERMQAVHENLYQQYMNPAFMLYLKQRGQDYYDKVYTALDLIMQHPYDFEYVPPEKGTQQTEVRIVKRRPHKTYSRDIDDNFSVTLESSQGYVIKVNGTDLRMTDQSIPWMTNGEYNKKMSEYFEAWQMAQEKKLQSQRYLAWEQNNFEPPSEGDAIALEAFSSMPGPLKTIHELSHVEFPRRFVALVRTRGLGWEVGDERFKRVVEAQRNQGKNYNEITIGGKLWMMVVADPDIEGVYQIWTSEDQEKNREPLRVTREGFMLRDMGVAASPRWVVDPRYNHALYQRYYMETPGAEAKLEQAERGKAKKEQAEAAATSAEQEKIAETAQKLAEAKKKYQKKIEVALRTAKLEKVGELALAISQLDWVSNIEQLIEAQKREELLQGIQKVLDADQDGSIYTKAAEVLDVQ